MRAQAVAAAWQAVCDYDPKRGVPFIAFMYQRVLASALNCYRREWAYTTHCVSQADEKGEGSIAGHSLSSPTIHELLRCALAQLSASDRWLIKQLFWEGRTETEIAVALGVSQQMVSKRKRKILCDLSCQLDTA